MEVHYPTFLKTKTEYVFFRQSHNMFLKDMSRMSLWLMSVHAWFQTEPKFQTSRWPPSSWHFLTLKKSILCSQVIWNWYGWLYIAEVLNLCVSLPDALCKDKLVIITGCLIIPYSKPSDSFGWSLDFLRLPGIHLLSWFTNNNKSK